MKNSDHICLNCEHPLKEKDKYCPQCGQKASYQNMSIRYLFGAFLDAFFYFDRKLFRSLRDVWRPNLILNEYVSGKRKNYVHPFRLLFLLLLIFFGLIALSMRNEIINEGGNMKEKIAKYEVYERFQVLDDSIRNAQNADILDTVKARVFHDVVDYAQDTFWNGELMGVDFQEKGITTRDMFYLPLDSLYSKYQVDHWSEQFVIQQLRRVVMDLNQSIRFVIANMLWGFILITIIIAIVIQILYIRHGPYYVENFMHVVIFHTQLLILWSFLMLINLFTPVSEAIFFLTSLVPLGLLFYNLMKYYSQGPVKTLVKYFIIHVFYLIVLVLVIVIIALTSLLFF